MNVRL